jgi:hypothetical protein
LGPCLAHDRVDGVPHSSLSYDLADRRSSRTEYR